MATIPTLFYGRLWLWPRRKGKLDKVFIFIISFKCLNEITSFFFSWKGNII